MKHLYIETYGCQMNVADSEVVASVMKMAGYEPCESLDEADAVFLNTCSVRDNAEQKIIHRLEALNALRRKGRKLIIGVLGCMAERVKDGLLNEHGADLVAGPDAYLSLPDLIAQAEVGNKAIDIELSTTETYRDIVPERYCGSRISGFVSIMRGCNNFCHYCIVPYTRGRERSRDIESILTEARDLESRNYKEITLLGQNVNSYCWKREDGTEIRFPELLRTVARAVPGLRIRFSTSHPKDMSDETLHVIAEEPNVCRHIHLPVQSGNDHILKMMNRNYTREKYLSQVATARRYMPDIVITTDIIVGFPNETEEEFEDTISLCEEVRFDAMFTFIYSKRVGTPAASMPDPYTRADKQKHFDRLMDVSNRISGEKHKEYEGKTVRVLVDGETGREEYNLSSRTNGGRLVHLHGDKSLIGQFVNVKIVSSNTWALYGEIEKG